MTTPKANTKAKTVKRESQVAPEPNGQQAAPSYPPYMMPHLLAERVWNHLPAYFDALKTLSEQQTQTNALLIEIRDNLKEK